MMLYKKIAVLFIFVFNFKAFGQDPIATINIPEQKDYLISLEKYYSIYEDKNQNVSETNINNINFEKSEKNNFNRIEYPIWLRVNIANNSENPQNTSLWLQEAIISDSMQVYEIKNNSLILLGKTGAFIDYELRPYQAKDLIVPMQFFSYEEKKLLIKMSNRGPTITKLIMIPIATYEKISRTEYIIYSMLFGAMLINIIYNFLLFFRLRELIILYYTLYLTALGLLFLALNGMGAQFWGTYFQRNSASYGSILTGIFLLQFTKKFLQSYKYHPRIRFISSVMQIFLSILLILYIIYPKIYIGKPLLYVDIIVILHILYSIILGIKRRFMPAYAFAIGWGAFFAGAMLFIISSLGFIPANFFSDYGIHIGSFVQMAFLSLATADRISNAQNEINRLNEKKQIELEVLVKERTEEMRLILDNVKSAFFRIDDKLIVQPGYTISCQTLLGPLFKNGISLIEILGLDEVRAEQFSLVLQQVFDDSLPEKVALSLIPRNIKVKNRNISVQIGSVRGDNKKIRNIIFTLDDSTEYVAAQHQREIDSAIISCFQQKSAFNRFLKDSKELLKQCKNNITDDEQVRSLLHTIKGNAAIFNLNKICNFIHGKEEENKITETDLNEIEDSIRSFISTYMSSFGVSFDEESEEMFQIGKIEIQNFQNEIKTKIDFASLLALAQDFANHLCKKSVSDILGPIDQNVRSLANKLNKKISFEIRGGSLLINQEKTQTIFNNIIHLIRNSIDHGIEKPKERIALGKKEFGSIIFDVSYEDKKLILKISDDGRGLDPDFIGKIAVQKNIVLQEELSKMTKREIQSLIFKTGFSTTSEVSSLSGRGVGMKAVIDAIEKNGATLDFSSEVGQGTIFIIKI